MDDDEEKLLRSVAIQNAQSILLARQRAEQELVDAKEALELRTAELECALTDLRFQNEINRTIAENAASCLLMLDDHGIATYMNPAATEKPDTRWRSSRRHPSTTFSMLRPTAMATLAKTV